MTFASTVLYYFQPRNIDWLGWLVFVAINVLGIVLWRRSLDPALDGVKNLKKRWKFARTVLKNFPAFITPDGITLFRLPLLVLALANMAFGIYESAFWWTVAHEICDFLDGALADVRQISTPFGEIADPLVDKIATTSTLDCFGLILVMLGARMLALPFWPLIVISSWYAFKLTIVRWNKGSMATAAKGTFAAKSHGKLKAVCEDVAVPAAILALYTHLSPPFLLDAWELLLASCILARLSLRSQSAQA